MQPILIFDGDCGFCTSAVNFTRRWIRPDCDIQPWQWIDLDRYGLTEAACSEAVQYVTADHRVFSGSSAVTHMLKTAPTPWPIVAAIGERPVFARIANRLYRWTAANRGRLPGATPACANPPVILEADRSNALA